MGTAIDLRTGLPPDVLEERPHFTGERWIPFSPEVEPTFERKMYQEHLCRYLFAAQFASGRRVLDVACGVGYGSAVLALKGASAVTGIDLSSESIAFARSVYASDHVRFLEADAQAIPLEDGAFDLVVAFECLEHVQQPERLLSEIRRLLAPGGIALISTPRRKEALRSPFHVHEFTFEEFEGALRSHFKEHRLLVEQNVFSSQIDSGDQAQVYREEVLARQDLRRADYFVAVCGDIPARIDPIRVVNDDAYVLNLEHDVEVLHAAENRLAAENTTLTTQKTAVEEQLASERLRVADLSHQLERLQDLEWWVNHYRKMTPRPAYYVLRGLYLARMSVETAVREGPRSFLDRAARYVLKRLGDPEGR